MENEIAVVAEPDRALIFGTADPAGIITKATAVADALMPLIEKKKLYKQIGPKKHVYVDGWNTMLAMLGIFPNLEYSRKLDLPEEIAYEAKVSLKHVSGLVVGSGQALCSSLEKNWKGKDEFQISSMAQTRATGKAARLSFSWIINLAGYETTPAEEMEGIKPAKEQPTYSMPSEVEPEGTAQEPDDAPNGGFVPTEIKEAKGTNKETGKPWVKWAIVLPDGRAAGTFSESFRDIAMEAKAKGTRVIVEVEEKGKFLNVKDVRPA